MQGILQQCHGSKTHHPGLNSAQNLENGAALMFRLITGVLNRILELFDDAPVTVSTRRLPLPPFKAQFARQESVPRDLEMTSYRDTVWSNYCSKGVPPWDDSTHLEPCWNQGDIRAKAWEYSGLFAEFNPMI